MRSLSKNIPGFIRQPGFLAFIYFIVMTIVMTYPLILKMGSVAPGYGGDGSYFIWLVGWYQKALFQLKISPFLAPYLNYPQGWDLATTDITPAMVAFALPGGLLFGPTWGYNFSMLLSFVLSGWAMYLWVKHLTNDSWAGLVAGTIFAFLPYRMAHFLVGHLNLVGTQWFPFYFWGLFDLLKQEKFSWKPVLMAGIAAGLIGLTSPYYVYMTAVISAVFLLGFILFRGYWRLKHTVFWKSLLAFGLLAIVLVGLSMLPYIHLSLQNGLETHTLDEMNRYSASPTDFFIPSIKQFLWGDWVEKTFNPEIFHEATLYIGAVGFVLMVIAWIKHRQLQRTDLLGIATLTAVSAFVLAMGMQLHWMGKLVVSLPGFLQSIFHRTKIPAINLPAYYLRLYLPFFSKMRVLMRFGFFTLIFTSLMAGLGSYVILGKLSAKRRALIAVILLVLVFVDFYPGGLKNLAPVRVSPAYTWLATQPDSGAVAVFPFADESGQQGVYNTLIYHKPFLGGDFSANRPEQFTRIYPTMSHFPTMESIDLLKQLGVAYVIVDSSKYPNFYYVDRDARSFGLQLLHADDDLYVYGLRK